jgi:hypothetical protein
VNPAEYEQYVEELVRQLDFGSEATIIRNAKLPGVRQPGEYEIDVAVRVQLGGRIDFLLIIECKNWSHRVDRPVVQKLVQTRDAVAAHKAAVVSPVGFSQEAIAVAEANGVALWVISEVSWTRIMGSTGPDWQDWIPYHKRVESLQQFGLDTTNMTSRATNLSLIRLQEAKEVGGERGKGRYTMFAIKGSAVTHGDNEPGVDPRLAITELVDDLARAAGFVLAPACRST